MLVLFFSLIFKIGLFPGHAWVADVAEGLSYSSFAIINILIKFALLIFLKSIFMDFSIFFNLILYIGICSYILGILLTLYQKKLIRFLVFGSTSHLGLIITAYILIEIDFFSFIFLSLYLISLYKFVYLLENVVVNIQKIWYIVDLNFLLDLDTAFWYIFSFIEISGLPPLNIFILKLIFLLFLIKNNLFYLTLIFLFFSIISTFYYIRLVKNLMYDLNTSFVFSEISIFYGCYLVLEYLFLLLVLSYPSIPDTLITYIDTWFWIFFLKAKIVICIIIEWVSWVIDIWN